MDGRDIGTVVPSTCRVEDLLVASVEERAERRYKENVEKGITADLELLKKKSLSGTIRTATVPFLL